MPFRFVEGDNDPELNPDWSPLTAGETPQPEAPSGIFAQIPEDVVAGLDVATAPFGATSGGEVGDAGGRFPAKVGETIADLFARFLRGTNGRTTSGPGSGANRKPWAWSQLLGQTPRANRQSPLMRMLPLLLIIVGAVLLMAVVRR